MKSSSVHELRRKVVLSTSLHNSQVSSLSCLVFSLPVLFPHFQVQHKRPGCICSWNSDRQISKSRWESFAGIAQEECYYRNYNFPLQPANKPGIRQGACCKTTLITLVDGKGCSALAALWLVRKMPEGQSNHGSTLKRP